MTIISTPGCGMCFRVKTILKNKGVPYKEASLDSFEGQEIVKEAPSKELPIMKLENGTIYCGKNALLFVKGL